MFNGGNMKLIREVNILEDKKIIVKLNIVGVILMFVWFIPFFLIGLNFAKDFDNAVSFDKYIANPLIRILLHILILLIIVVIHELIHGLFFKFFTPRGKVKFGFTSGMAYATSPGNYYTKWQMFIIAVAPFVGITVGLTLLMYYLNIDIVSYATIASLHAGACVGDFYYVYLLLKAPKGTMVEDTEQGIRLYVEATT